MSNDPLRTRLDAELADLDQQLRFVEGSHDLSDGEKVFTRGFLRHERRKKLLEIEILGQGEIVKAQQREVAPAQTRFEMTRSPDGMRVLLKREMRRMAGMALGGGSQRRFSPWEMLTPEQRVMQEARGNLTRAEVALRDAQTRLSNLRQQMHELQDRDADWVRLRPQKPASRAEIGTTSRRSPEEALAAESQQPSDGEKARIQIGHWASDVMEELKKLNRFALGKDVTENALRQEFPTFRLWTDVVDRLSNTAKDRFLDEIKHTCWKQLRLFDLMANVREMSGPTLYDYYKGYRRAAGLSRKRLPQTKKPSATNTALTR